MALPRPKPRRGNDKPRFVPSNILAIFCEVHDDGASFLETATAQVGHLQAVSTLAKLVEEA